MNLRRSTIAIALSGVLAMPTLAHAAPAQHRALRLEVDVSALPKEDRYTEDTRQWVLETQTAALEGAGFTVTDAATDVVRIEISRYGDYGIHTRAKLMLVGDAASAREFTCEACKDSDFIAKVDEETKRLAEHLSSDARADGALASESTPATEGSTAPADVAAHDRAESEASEAPADHGGKRLGGMGYAGIASLAGGLGLALGGIVVLVEKPSQRLLPGKDNDIEVTDRRPLGVSLTGVGAGLLIAGAALLIVDQTVLRKRRGSKERASAFTPTVWSTGATLSWTMRF